MLENDVPSVYAIELRTFSHPWKENDFLQSIQNPNNIYLVVEENNSILGYCGLWGVVGEGQITNVAVAEPFHGKGIAKAMLSELLRKGREHGLETFTLEVRVSNYSAIALYHNLGFKDAGIRKNFYEAPTEDAIIMWL